MNPRSLLRARLPRVIVPVALGIALAPAPEADACGAFFRRRQPTERAPSLSLERVLIVHDAATQTEHFVREVVFQGGAEVFGFVVPTPSRPEIFKVKTSPFDRLEERFPFAPLPSRGRSGRGSDAPTGATKGVAPRVAVLEVKRVGSFTAFVLKANDAGALGKWLADNQLGSTPENDAWLAEYVARDFYYVAMRYEPKASGDGALASETVRISFKAPAPFYPYREPEHGAATAGAGPGRAVLLWLVASQPSTPVAPVSGPGEPWARPFREGVRRPGVRGDAIAGSLGDAEARLLSRDQHYSVQPFEDQKRDRSGFGDVVFLPETRAKPEHRAALEKFAARVLGPKPEKGSK